MSVNKITHIYIIYCIHNVNVTLVLFVLAILIRRLGFIPKVTKDNGTCIILYKPRYSRSRRYLITYVGCIYLNGMTALYHYSNL